MEGCKFIFEQLGENRVTHPIEANLFEEGAWLEIDREESPKQPSVSAPKSQPVPVHVPMPSPDPPKRTTSFLEALMFWRHPEISLLASPRQQEELKKFKTDLVKAVAVTKTKVDKEAVIESLSTNTPSYDAMEFLSHLWGASICSPHGVHGNCECNEGVWIKMDSYNNISQMMTRGDIEKHRAEILKEHVWAKKLNGVKEIKDLFKALQLPVTKTCPETQKKKPLLKHELQDIIKSYTPI